jgi:tartrate dehydratase beta subunit/fumarate hydratase class I family protein
MNSIPIRNVWFDDAATLTMGEAFDHACESLHRFGTLITARELLAKRIIDAAKNGERDPDRLCQQALIPFGIEDMSMLVVSVGPKPPVPAYASVTLQPA